MVRGTFLAVVAGALVLMILAAADMALSML
jgi:hypothetical protein